MKRITLGILAMALFASAARAGEEPATSGVREVIIVFKTHFDIGYTDLASKIVERYRTTMIDQALHVVEESRGLPPEQRFAWTIPGWPMKTILGDDHTQTAERRQRVMAAIREGRFVVHAQPFTQHTELLEPEDLVRGLGYSSQVSRAAGLPLPRDAKQTDVPSHSWILPTLLRHAGVDFLHLGCNAASSSPDVPTLFWWEGPDGSRLLTMYSAAGYGTALKPPANWPYHTWLALEHTGDNQGPPTPQNMTKILKEAAETLPGVKVRIGRLSDFSDALLAEKADIPVVRGDMPDTWIHGPMCDPAGARIARNVRPAIGVVESLGTLLRGWSVSVPDSAADLAAAREGSLLYGEHTWGGALYWVTPYGKDINWGYGEKWKTDRTEGRFRKLEQSWAEHTAYIEKARDLTRPLLAGALDSLARAVAVEGRRIVVFNPLPWKRDGLVRMPAPHDGPSAVRPADGGPAVPVATDREELVFLARDIPAQGYRTYLPTDAADQARATRSDVQTGGIENAYLTVKIDPARGGVVSVIDRRSGRELVDQSSEYLLGQYVYERFDTDQVAAYANAYVKVRADWALAELGKPNMPPASEVPHRAGSPRAVAIRMESTPVAEIAVLHADPSAEVPHGVTTRVILPAGQPYLDLEVTLHDKAADNWPEAGWVCLPVNAAQPCFRLGRLGGIADPARDFLRGSNRDIQAMNTGFTITGEDGRGAGVCPLDTPLVSLGQRGLFRYDPDYVPTRPIAFVNLFNNQWTTNFRMWNEGTWTSRFRVWSVVDSGAEAALITPSWEAREPLLAAMTDGPGGPLPVSRAGLELGRRGVLLSAFGPNPDGAGTVLRLWEQAGVSGPCEVRLPSGNEAASVLPVNLRGVPTGPPVPVQQGAFTARLSAFAPASYVLPPAE